MAAMAMVAGTPTTLRHTLSGHAGAVLVVRFNRTPRARLCRQRAMGGKEEQRAKGAL